MLECRGRVVVMGMGKSGHVGRKIAATLASTGTPAFFVHPAEASHGDLGMVMAGDVVLAISNSGESDELAAILPAMRRLGVTLVAMTGQPDSTLARHADIVLVQRGRRGGLPAEPGAHRQHHRADGAGRRAGRGAARRARLPRRGLRALAPRRRARPQAADARARRDAQRRRRAAAWRPAPASATAARDDRQGPGLHRRGRRDGPADRHLHRRRPAPPDRARRRPARADRRAT